VDSTYPCASHLQRRPEGCREPASQVPWATPRPAHNGREFAALVKRGLPPTHVLKMATVYAADLLGVDDRGVIGEGKRADVIAVPGNPLEDISVMENVRFVMKAGVVYKAPSL